MELPAEVMSGNEVTFEGVSLFLSLPVPNLDILCTGGKPWIPSRCANHSLRPETDRTLSYPVIYKRK